MSFYLKIKTWLQSPYHWIKKLNAHLIHEHSSPKKLALAVGIGFIVGTTPFYGFHLWICIALSFILKLNKVTVYLAANISNPLMSPFLIFASLQIGNFLLYKNWLPLKLKDLKGMDISWTAKHFFLSWLFGGFVLGLVIGIIGGITTYILLNYRRKKKELLKESLNEK